MSTLRRQDGIALIFEIFLVAVVLGLVALGARAILTKTNALNKMSGKTAQLDPWGEPCHIKQSGRAQLTASPLHPEDIQVIAPMGSMVGGHVTPIDHMYFYPNPTPGNRFAKPVYAAADGIITNIQHRGNITDGPPTSPPSSDEFRMTIEQTCNQGYYYDLITKLAPDIRTKVGTLRNSDGKEVDIHIKAGQLVGYVGNQSLDFGVYDTQVNLGFIVPEHYKAEPWKIHTADAFSYFEPGLLATLLTKDTRKAEPRAGKIAYDKDGYLVGNWFEQGTNGYGGKGQASGPHEGYWLGHLAVAYDPVDPRLIILSIGSLTANNGGQYAVVGNAPDPAGVTPSSGIVKYQLTAWNYILSDGSFWNRQIPNLDITAVPQKEAAGTVLFQMTAQRQLKMEVFMGKTASQVSGFDSGAKLYER